jgi:hypothetical protein
MNDLTRLSPAEHHALTRPPIDDHEALDHIAEMLRDPQWGAGMLEDIRQLVNRTGRTCDNYPDDRPTWERH